MNLPTNSVNSVVKSFILGTLGTLMDSTKILRYSGLIKVLV